jgi:hypothetical protein
VGIRVTVQDDACRRVLEKGQHGLV